MSTKAIFPSFEFFIVYGRIWLNTRGSTVFFHEYFNRTWAYQRIKPSKCGVLDITQKLFTATSTFPTERTSSANSPNFLTEPVYFSTGRQDLGNYLHNATDDNASNCQKSVQILNLIFCQLARKWPLYFHLNRHLAIWHLSVRQFFFFNFFLLGEYNGRIFLNISSGL